MAIVKLKEVGDALTMTVTECEATKGNFGDQVKFAGGGDILYLPKDSADRQLERLNLHAYADVVGESLTFSRTENKKKGAAPYWNIEVASGLNAPAKPSPRVKPSEADPVKGLPPSFGKPIPGLDADPMHDAREYLSDMQGDEGVTSAHYDRVAAQVRRHDAQNGPPAHHKLHPADAEMVGPWDTEGVNAAQPPLTPREVRERETAVDATASPAQRFLAFYVDTYAEMLAGLSAVHSAAVSANVGPRSRAPEAIPALTSDTVQAAVATYVIQCEKRGWLAR